MQTTINYTPLYAMGVLIIVAIILSLVLSNSKLRKSFMNMFPGNDEEDEEKHFSVGTYVPAYDNQELLLNNFPNHIDHWDVTGLNVDTGYLKLVCYYTDINNKDRYIEGTDKNFRINMKNFGLYDGSTLQFEYVGDKDKGVLEIQADAQEKRIEMYKAAFSALSEDNQIIAGLGVASKIKEREELGAIQTSRNFSDYDKSVDESGKHLSSRLDDEIDFEE